MDGSLVYDTTWKGVTTYGSLAKKQSMHFGNARYNDVSARGTAEGEAPAACCVSPCAPAIPTRLPAERLDFIVLHKHASVCASQPSSPCTLTSGTLNPEPKPHAWQPDPLL